MLRIKNAQFLDVILLCLFIQTISCRQDDTFIKLAEQIQNDVYLWDIQQVNEATFAVVTPQILDSALIHSAYYRSRLKAIEKTQLDETRKEQLDSLLQILEERQIYWERWQRDPSLYDLSGSIIFLLEQKDWPLEKRLRHIDQYLLKAPAYYKAAKENLKFPDSSLLELAAQRQVRSLRLLSVDLLGFIEIADLEEEEARQFRVNVQNVYVAVKDYLAFCESLWFEHFDSKLRQVVEGG